MALGHLIEMKRLSSVSQDPQDICVLLLFCALCIASVELLLSPTITVARSR